MDNLIIGFIVIALYLAASTRLSLFQSIFQSWLPQWALQKDRLHVQFLWLGGIAVLLHTILLYFQIHAGAGISLGFFNAASMVSWLIALALLIMSFSRPLENLALVLFPFVILMVVFTLLLPDTRLLPEHPGMGLTLHVLISILAYSLFCLSALLVLFLNVQEYYLHHKKPMKIMTHLPPIQVMENLLLQVIWVAMVLLSISLVTGGLFIENLFGQHLVHKTLLSIIAWLLFAVLLWGRRRYGWRGRLLLYWIFGGVFVLMLGYFGSKLVLEFVV
ncbi:cytochrome C assembly family protein [Candidatus Venteria ishoeyi]|nr:cytochrome c biogenesis protein CcsA [Candidatus Venteria ishoeyi]MDM8546795.1 cytochrome c biogenesis protein CcsA [Candidatus Venteria ishoeyi]